MKAWIILIALAVAVTAAGTVAVPLLSRNQSPRGPSFPVAAKPDGPAPEIEVVGDLVHKFGVMPQQTVGRRTVVFKNKGAGLLEIRGTSTSCSCTTSDLFEMVEGKSVGKLIKIKPGESLPVEMTWDTKMNDAAYRQQIAIATNDMSRNEIILSVEGTIRPPITTYPADPTVNFMVASNDEPVVRRVALYSEDRPDTKVIQVVSSDPNLIGVEVKPFTAEQVAASKVAKGYTIEVTLKPTSTLGEFAQEVLVVTDHPKKQEFRFKVKGKTVGPITALPEKIQIRDANSSDGGMEEVALLARGRSEVKFTVEAKPPGMEVAVEPLPPVVGLKGSKYKMTVKLAPGIQSGRILGEIVLKTDDPKASELRLPVDVLVQGAR